MTENSAYIEEYWYYIFLKLKYRGVGSGRKGKLKLGHIVRNMNFFLLFNSSNRPLQQLGKVTKTAPTFQLHKPYI